MCLGYVKSQSLSTKLNLYAITLCILPNFSPYALAPRTVSILIFWIVPLVLFPEFIKRYSCKKIQLLQLPNLTIFIQISCILLSLLALIYNDKIWVEDSNLLTDILRRSLFLIHPILVLSWTPQIDNNKQSEFIKIFTSLSVGFLITLVLIFTFDKTIVGQKTSNYTAHFAANILNLVNEEKVKVTNEYFYNNEYSVEVNPGCSSTSHICLSIFTTLIMYLCCKIKNKLKVFLTITLIFPIVFILNGLRITMLGYFVSINKMGLFNFWHHGAGSLIFTLLVMFLTCYLYYYFGTKKTNLKVHSYSI